MVAPAPSIRCRQIAEGDIAAVTALLVRGFPSRDRQFWQSALEQLGNRESPRGLPKYGYLLESGGAPVGALLMICSTVRTGDKLATRCNLSSWYVEPAFRSYARLLVARALSHKDVTYLNVSPAPHTRPIIEAQGFSRYCDGVFVALPVLNGLFGGGRTQRCSTRRRGRRSPSIRSNKKSFCNTPHSAASACGAPRPNAPIRSCSGRGAPRKYPVRATHLLPRRGRLRSLCRSDRDGTSRGAENRSSSSMRTAPIPGLIGVFRRGSMPKYFRGPQRAALGDLAYTEYAVMGV